MAAEFNLSTFIPNFYNELDRTDSHLSRILGATPITTLRRDTSCMSYVLMYALARGYSLDEVSDMSNEQKQQLGSDTLKFLEDHPLSIADPPASQLYDVQDTGSLKAHGELYSKAAEQFMKESWPQFDPDDSHDTSYADQQRLGTLCDISIDFSQTKEKAEKGMPFVEVSGGAEKMLDMDERMQAIGELADAARDTVPVIGMSAAERSNSKYVSSERYVQEYARLYRSLNGKTLADSAANFLKSSTITKAKIEKAALSTIAVSTPEERQSFREIVQSQLPRFTAAQTQQNDKQIETYKQYQKLNDWYKATELAQRADNAQANAAEQERVAKMSAAADAPATYPINLVDEYGKISMDMHKELRSRQRQLPFIAEANQPAASFLLNQLSQITEKCAQDQLRFMTLNNMQDALNGEGAKKIEPDLQKRQVLSAAIGRDIEQAQKSLLMNSYQQEAMPYLYTIFDSISGKDPMDILNTMESEANDNPQRAAIVAMVRQGLGDALAQQPDEQLKSLGLDGIFALNALPQQTPTSVTMDFANHPDFDANEFNSHVRKGFSKLSKLEREYAAATFDETFSSLYTDKQKDLQNLTGIDPLDLIIINGQTAKELYSNKYPRLTEDQRKEMIKCEIVSASLSSDPKISFNLIENPAGHELALSRNIVLQRGGALHDPKPTLGARFLQALGIRKIESLKQKFDKANSSEQLNADREASTLSILARADTLNAALAEGTMRSVERDRQRLRTARFDQEIRSLTGASINEIVAKRSQNDSPDLDPAQAGFVKLVTHGASLARPTAILGILYGQMLKAGMTLQEVLDPALRTDEKKEISASVNERMKTPQGIGEVLAESTKAFNKMDMKKEFGTILGQDRLTSEKMEEIFTSPGYAAKALPALHFFYTANRELFQVSNSFVPKKKDGPFMTLTAEQFKEMGEHPRSSFTDPNTHEQVNFEARNDTMFNIYQSYTRNMELNDINESLNMVELGKALMSHNALSTYENAALEGPERYSLTDPRFGEPTLDKVAGMAVRLRDVFSKIAQTDHIGEIQPPQSGDEGFLTQDSVTALSAMGKPELDNIITARTNAVSMQEMMLPAREAQQPAAAPAPAPETPRRTPVTLQDVERRVLDTGSTRQGAEAGRNQNPRTRTRDRAATVPAGGEMKAGR